MAKQSGLGDQLLIGGVDIGADTSAIGSLATPRATLDSTGITQSANERLFGKGDGTAEFTTYFNDAAGGTFEKLKALPTSNQVITYLRGQGIGSAALCMVGLQLNHDGTRGDEGDFTFQVAVNSTGGFGVDWCDQLTTGKQTFASAANGTGYDTAASVSFGFQAYAQVISLGSGTPTLKIQDSADNATFADLADGSFGVVTAGSAARIQSSSATATVRRYLRVATTGTFTNLVCVVAINKNQALRSIT